MNLQVIVSTMHQNDYSLIDKMNIRSDVVVVNQCETNDIETFSSNGYKVTWINSTTRGVGKSRNIGILHSTADIVLFADDDVSYNDEYTETITSFFEKNPKCSLAVFNLLSLNPKRPEYIIKKTKRIHLFNCLRYGAFRIAVLRVELLRNNVWYSLLFGGGAKYQAGEDNLFITQCIKTGMMCIAVAQMIGTVKQEDSTWFKGYDAKYYMDRGALFYSMYGKKAGLVLMVFDVKERLSNKKSDMSIFRIHSLEKQGIKDY